MSATKHDPRETLLMAAQVITDKGSHAFAKHHVQSNEFNKTRYGVCLNINSSEDLAKHAERVLTDPRTRTVHTRFSHIYAYHEPTQTVVILGWDRDGGTIFRRYPEHVQRGESWFKKMVALEADILGVASFPEKTGGVLKLLQEDEKLDEKLHERYERMLARLRSGAAQEQRNTSPQKTEPTIKQTAAFPNPEVGKAVF